MTRDDIIKLAQEAGFVSQSEPFCGDVLELSRFALFVGERFAAAEREACAQIADYYAENSLIALSIATEIRARSIPARGKK